MEFWDIIWFITVSFFFIAYLMVMFAIIGDLFRDDSVGGVAKAAWVLTLIFLPLVTSLVYLVVRGKGMAERRQAEMVAMQKQQEAYIRSVATPGAAGSSATEQIAEAKRLLDIGAIDQVEYAALKAKAVGTVPGQRVQDSTRTPV